MPLVAKEPGSAPLGAAKTRLSQSCPVVRLLTAVIFLSALLGCRTHHDPQSAYDHARKTLSSGDLAAAAKETQQAYDEFHGLSAEWAWKFQEEPEGRWITVALDQAGKVIAHCAAIAVRMQAGDLLVRAGHLVDNFSLREARRGLGAARAYLRTVEWFTASFGGPDGLALLFGFAGERLVRLAQARLGHGQMVPQPVDVQLLQYGNSFTRLV